jgi:hypothetical protein
MDISNLPTSVTLTNQLTGDFQRAHNIFIDVPNGRLYVAGSNTRNRGLWVYDIASDPANPSVIGSPLLNNYGGPDDSYVHDLYVEDNIAYCSHGYNGFYYYNISNAALPYVLGGTPNTNGYNHSSWLIPGGQYLVFAQEVPKGLPLEIVDIHDDLSTVATIKEPLLAPAHLDNTPHNPFVKGNLLYVSYYEDGVQVFNISDIQNPVRVAYYDTEPDNTSYSGTNNNWGVYPFLPSGHIIASDTEHGLFVLSLQASALPVDWLSAAAVPIDPGIELRWATATESNNREFCVEKSLDGTTFSVLGKVEGAGSSTQVQSYRFLDHRPAKGINYYRVRQVDFDGNHAYSDILAARWEKCSEVYEGILLQIGQEIPLPPLLGTLEGEASIRMANGALLYTLKWEAGQSHIGNTAALNPGSYFISYETECGTILQKMVLVR